MAGIDGCRLVLVFVFYPEHVRDLLKSLDPELVRDPLGVGEKSC